MDELGYSVVAEDGSVEDVQPLAAEVLARNLRDRGTVPRCADSPVHRKRAAYVGARRDWPAPSKAGSAARHDLTGLARFLIVRKRLRHNRTQ